MGRHILYAALTFLIAFKVDAQIAITASDISAQLQLGKKITSYRDGVTTSLNIGSTGQTTWDFSSLVIADQYVTESKTVATSAYAADFTGAQFASYYEGVSQGNASQSWVYNTISTDYFLNGTGSFTSPQGISTVVKLIFSPQKLLYKLPITLNASWVSQGSASIKTTITLPVLGSQTTTVAQTYQSNFLVDAWGAVKMPDGKILNALRVREESSITTAGQTATSVMYHILTKTGESLSITLKNSTANSGVVNIEGVSWSSGDGVSNPTNVEKTSEIPRGFSLSQNYPNPFNPSTKISFSLPQSSFVNLSVYEITGREVTNLLNQQMNAGTYAVDFNSANLSSGIYLYKISAGTFLQTKKMILIK